MSELERGGTMRCPEGMSAGRLQLRVRRRRRHHQRWWYTDDVYVFDVFDTPRPPDWKIPNGLLWIDERWIEDRWVVWIELGGWALPGLSFLGFSFLLSF